MIGQATLTTATDNLRITTFLSTPPILPYLPLYILFHPFQFFLILPLLRVHVRVQCLLPRSFHTPHSEYTANRSNHTESNTKSVDDALDSESVPAGSSSLLHR